jgi:hypothetical protein
MNEYQKIAGKVATVNKPGAVTHGKQCVVEAYDKEAKKYRVGFDESWQGWYKRSELEIE